jgi:hypothetical protein
MKSFKIQVTTLAIASFLSVSAQAGPSSDELGTCFVQSTSGKDRVTLVMWIFNTISMNPRVKDITISIMTINLMVMAYHQLP